MEFDGDMDCLACGWLGKGGAGCWRELFGRANADEIDGVSLLIAGRRPNKTVAKVEPGTPRR